MKRIRTGALAAVAVVTAGCGEDEEAPRTPASDSPADPALELTDGSNSWRLTTTNSGRAGKGPAIRLATESLWGNGKQTTSEEGR